MLVLGRVFLFLKSYLFQVPCCISGMYSNEFLLKPWRLWILFFFSGPTSRIIMVNTNELFGCIQLRLIWSSKIFIQEPKMFKVYFSKLFWGGWTTSWIFWVEKSLGIFTTDVLFLHWFERRQGLVWHRQMMVLPFWSGVKNLNNLRRRMFFASCFVSFKEILIWWYYWLGRYFWSILACLKGISCHGSWEL